VNVPKEVLFNVHRRNHILLVGALEMVLTASNDRVGEIRVSRRDQGLLVLDVTQRVIAIEPIHASEIYFLIILLLFLCCAVKKS
jgi:hypothetical protein